MVRCLRTFLWCPFSAAPAIVRSPTSTHSFCQKLNPDKRAFSYPERSIRSLTTPNTSVSYYVSRINALEGKILLASFLPASRLQFRLTFFCTENNSEWPTQQFQHPRAHTDHQPQLPWQQIRCMLWKLRQKLTLLQQSQGNFLLGH